MATFYPAFMVDAPEPWTKTAGSGDSMQIGQILANGVAATDGNGGNVAFDANSARLIRVADPVAATDGANKRYVDSNLQGLKPKGSVVAVATTNIATMSGIAQTVDGIALNTAGMRVALTGQTTATQNGIWVVAAGAWVRASDMDVGSNAASAHFFVERGTTYGETGWVCTSDTGSAIVGTSSLAFTQFTGVGQLTAGAGLIKSGAWTLDVQTGNGIDAATNDRVELRLAANPGMEFDTGSPANQQGVRVKAYNGITRDGNGVSVKQYDGIIVDGNGVSARLGNGVVFGSEAAGLKTINAKQYNGILVDGSGISTRLGNGLGFTGTAGQQNIQVTQHDGIQVVASGVQARLTANGGLELDTAAAGSKGIKVKVAAASGTQINATTGAVEIDAYKGLSIDATYGLQLALGDGLEFDNSIVGQSGNARVKLADSTLSRSASGVAVAGVPNTFTIGGVAVSANVTAANLNALTGGGATTLHTHPTTPTTGLQLTYAADENIGKYSPVYFKDNNRVGNATADGSLAASGKTYRVIGVANTSTGVLANANVDIIAYGPLPLAAAGLSGSAGDAVYLSESGGIRLGPPPLGSGHRHIRIGSVINATGDMFVGPIVDYGQR